jgi:hypothetical protein
MFNFNDANQLLFGFKKISFSFVILNFDLYYNTSLFIMVTFFEEIYKIRCKTNYSELLN